MKKVRLESDRLISALDALRPARVRAEVEAMTGARVRSSDPSKVGGRSANTPVPMLDATDRWALAQLAAYEKHLQDALDSLRSALRRQDTILACLHDRGARGGVAGAPTEAARELAAGDVGDAAVECANCGVVIDKHAGEKVLGGRCRPCHSYLKKHKRERPPDLWVKAAA